VGDNYAALIEDVARAAATRPAIVWPDGAMAWEELDRRAARCAGGLAARGVRAGDRIAVALPNGWEFVVAFLGGLKLGATVAPINPRLTQHELASITDDLAPALVVTELPEGGDELRARTPIASAALILYTSGSTGQPKGSVFPHEALIEAIDALVVTVLPAVATMFRRVLDSPGFSPARLASLRLALSGAAPCPWELAREWRERTGVRLLRGYGMTELFRPISYLCGDSVERPEAIGRAVPGVDLRVVDEDGAPLTPGEVGELHVWSPARLERYLNAPDGLGALSADGWFATGDLACIGGDGLVSIVGRKKDLILRGGYSVSPAEVEAVLLAHPAVGEAAVVGHPHPELGEDVLAFVALRPQAHVEPEELIAHCASRLAAFKCPRQVRMVPALPRSDTGKVQKWRLA